MAIVRYAGNRMTGVSGDTKPTDNLITGTVFQETNTDDLYIWDGDSWNVVAGNTIAQTFSSKTFGDHITVAEISTPGTPSSGYGAIYAKSDNKLYFKNDAGTEVDLTNQASGGEANQNAWNTIAVSGQDNVVADSSTDTLTLAAGSNITLTTNASNDTVTITSASGSQNLFQTIAVSGQSDVVADSSTDTLTLVGGTNITLTTNASTDTVTIAASSSSATATVTDNEATNENNLITFVADAATSTGAHGLEMDGDLHYNPSTGRITATQLAGTLQTAAQTNITSVGVLDGGSITSNFGSINVGSSTITTSGVVTAGGFTIGSAAITEAELEILDGAAVTTAELNIIDGNTAATGTTLAAADRVVVNDNGTMVQVALTDFETYFESALDTLSNVTTVGTLTGLDLTSGDKTIFSTVGNNTLTIGASNTTVAMAGDLTVTGDFTVSGDTTTVNTATVTIEDPLMALANNNTTNSVDIGFYGKYRTNGTDLYTGLVWDGSASQYILFHANQAAPSTTVNTGGTGHAVSTLVANITGNVSGSSGTSTGLAGSATILATARTIAASGDITWTSASFNGSANVTSVAAITADVIVNADVKSDAAIVDTKLATISTANKVGLAALDIDGGTEIGANIVDADLFIIDDGAGGTNRKTLASRLKTYIGTSGEANEYAFKTIAVSGQTDVVADTTTDTLTLVAGANMTITTSGDSITLVAASASGASESFAIAMAVAL